MVSFFSNIEKMRSVDKYVYRLKFVLFLKSLKITLWSKVITNFHDWSVPDKNKTATPLRGVFFCSDKTSKQTNKQTNKNLEFQNRLESLLEIQIKSNSCKKVLISWHSPRKVAITSGIERFHMVKIWNLWIFTWYSGNYRYRGC